MGIMRNVDFSRSVILFPRVLCVSVNARDFDSSNILQTRFTVRVSKDDNVSRISLQYSRAQADTNVGNNKQLCNERKLGYCNLDCIIRLRGCIIQDSRRADAFWMRTSARLSCKNKLCLNCVIVSCLFRNIAVQILVVKRCCCLFVFSQSLRI